MPKLFISYRRADSQDPTERIHDRLVLDFGEENVFIDVDRKISAGDHFADKLRKEMAVSDAVLVIVGGQWLRMIQGRANDPQDFVRLEVEMALESGPNKLVIPVLLNDTEMPASADLPEDVRGLAARQAFRVRRNPDFHKDMGTLINEIKTTLADKIVDEFLDQFDTLPLNTLRPELEALLNKAERAAGSNSDLRQQVQRRRGQLQARYQQRNLLLVGSTVILTLVVVGLLLAASGVFDRPEPITLETQVALILTETQQAQVAAVQTAERQTAIAELLTQYAISTNEVLTITADALTDTPSPTATASNTPTSTFTPQPTVTATNTATHTATSTPTHTPNRTATNAAATAAARATETVQAQIAANQNTNTPLPTDTPTHTPTSTPTDTPTTTPTLTFTPTSTNTATPTLTLTPTLPPTATSTPNLTVTAVAQATQLFAATSAFEAAQATLDAQAAQPTTTPQTSDVPPDYQAIAVMSEDENKNLRAGPGLNFEVVDFVASGDQVYIIGQNGDASWYRVWLDADTYGWIPGQFLTISSTATPTAPAARETQARSSAGLSADAPITQNRDWRPQIKNINGLEAVLVPTGCFQMGRVEGGSDDERPVHEQCFDEPFWIGRTEVTNAQYQRCVEDGACSRPFDTTYFADPDYASHPVTLISWRQAVDYAAWIGGRLPSEREWEYAARGPDSLIYPWGNDLDSGLPLNYCDRQCEREGNDETYDDGFVETAAVGFYRDGASWVGALDMAGNVSEWTSSIIQPYPYVPDDGREDPDNLTDVRVTRGGSWYLYYNFARTDARYAFAPRLSFFDTGLRVVFDYEANSDVSGLSEVTLQQAAVNADWQPVIETFDGAEMALVPAGCFLMGENGEGGQQCFDQPFWIDVYEVRNVDYGSAGLFSGANQPRERVTWFEAQNFCAQRNGRLPTEREWEYAARGPDGLIFPWGDEFIEDNVVYQYNSNNQTALVGSRRGGASWVGALDMSGNILEWTSSLWRGYPYDPEDGREGTSPNIVNPPVLRGGSWFSGGERFVRASERFNFNPFEAFRTVGFRCARDYP